MRKLDSSQLKILAKEYETPLYIYDEQQIRKNYRKFSQAFQKRYEKSKIFYAYKANSNLTLCHILKEEGAKVDAVSGGEVITALKIGLNSENIIFTNNAKTQKEIEMSLDEGVIINADSLDELYKIQEIAKDKKVKAKISFRVNPSVDPDTHPKIATGMKKSKFGIHLPKLAFKAYEKAKEMENIEIRGIHTHIGSQITDMNAFEESTEKIMKFVYRLQKELGVELEFVDMGGGLGIPYKGKKENAPQPQEMAEAIVPVVKKWNKKLNYKPELWLEPGRYLVGNAGILLCEVESVKETPYKRFVNVNAGFHVFARPILYDGHHDIKAIKEGKSGKELTYDVAGNICESGDILGEDRDLPELERGDLITIHDVGAYGFSMASQYNSRPRPAEVLIKEDSIELIRERENYKDLFLHQKKKI